MSEASWRAVLKTALEGVTNIGVVNDYARYADELTGLAAHYKTTISGTPQMRGWNIGLETLSAENQGIGKNVRRTLTFMIRGYLSLDDSAGTEKIMAALTEDVMDALDDNAALHTQTANAGRAQLITFKPWTFAGVLCHYVEITQKVAEARTAAA